MSIQVWSNSFWGAQHTQSSLEQLRACKFTQPMGHLLEQWVCIDIPYRWGILGARSKVMGGGLWGEDQIVWMDKQLSYTIWKYSQRRMQQYIRHCYSHTGSRDIHHTRLVIYDWPYHVGIGVLTYKTCPILTLYITPFKWCIKCRNWWRNVAGTVKTSSSPLPNVGPTKGPLQCQIALFIVCLLRSNKYPDTAI